MEPQVDPLILSKALATTEHAESQQVSSQKEYEYCGKLLTDIVVPLRKEIESTFGPMKEKAWAAHKEIVAQEKRHLEPVQRAEQIIKGKLGKYIQEQEEVRRKEQARLEEEERQRVEEEALQNAIDAEASGAAPEEVQAVLEQPAIPIAVVAPPAVQKVQGVSSQVRYSVSEKIDMARLMHFVLANPHLGNLVQPNLAALNSLARSQKELFDIPGVQLLKETGIWARGR